MSLCVIIYNNKNILMSSDSRRSFRKNKNELFYVDDEEEKKIQVVGDKVIFNCGLLTACNEVIDIFKNSNGTIDELIKISEEVHDRYYILDKERWNKLEGILNICGFLVGYYDNDRTNIIQIAPHREIKTYIGADETRYLVSGFQKDKVAELLKDDNIGNMPAIDIYPFVYNAVANEGVGGKLKVFSIQKEGIDLYMQRNIIDSKNLKSMKLNKLCQKNDISLTGDIILLESGMNSSGATGNAIRIYAGASAANMASAPFIVYQNGNLYAQNVDVEGVITASGIFSGNVNGTIAGTSSTGVAGNANNSVQLGSTYSNVQTTVTAGIQIFNASGIEVVQLGNYATSKYGLEILNASGTVVVLDQDGLLQSWGDSLSDNIDSTHKLKLKFYIPDEILSIRQLKLNFSLEAFRAYETGASSGGGSTSGSGGSSTPTSGASSASSTGVNSGSGVNAVSSYQSSHDHSGAVASDGGHTHTTFVINDHTHGMSHTHQVTINSHTHSTPSHTHDITYGIYESTSATGVKVYVDNTLRLDNGGAGYSTDQANLDLSSWITTAGWHTIELSSTQLGRINAAYFIQVFLGV